MLRRLFTMPVGFLFCSAILSWAWADGYRANLRWHFGYAEGNIKPIAGEKMMLPEYYGKFMIFWKSIGFGTAIWERNNFHDYATGEFQIDNTTYYWRISKERMVSHFPLIVHWVPYSRSLGFGTLSLYSYLKGSWWIPPDREIYHLFLRSWEGKPGLYWLYHAYLRPSSYIDFGLGISFNPLRIVPLNLHLGVVKMKYLFPSPPEPYKDRIPSISRTVSTYYLTVNSALGYDFQVSKVKVKPMWRFDLAGMDDPVIAKMNGVAFESPWEKRKHIGELTLFWGSIGMGTTIYDEIGLCDHVEYYREEESIIQDCGCGNQHLLKSYFPIIIYCIPYTKPFGYGNLSLYGYFKGSAWALTESPERGRRPSSYFDLGIGLSLNPLRVVPFDLRFGILKINYQRISETYESQIVPDHIIQFYISFGPSIGYWNVRRSKKIVDNLKRAINER